MIQHNSYVTHFIHAYVVFYDTLTSKADLITLNCIIFIVTGAGTKIQGMINKTSHINAPIRSHVYYLLVGWVSSASLSLALSHCHFYHSLAPDFLVLQIEFTILRYAPGG